MPCLSVTPWGAGPRIAGTRTQAFSTPPDRKIENCVTWVFSALDRVRAGLGRLRRVHADCWARDPRADRAVSEAVFERRSAGNGTNAQA